MSRYRAVIVPRVSTTQQATEGTSMEAQEAACLHTASTMGAEVVATYRDEGVSGALYLTREGMQKALADIEAGKANVLITAKLDRAGRDVEALRDIRRRVRLAGGQLVFADGLSFKHDATGNLMFTQLAAFAEFERETIRDRTMAGSRRMAEKGIQPVRAMRPYGYTLVTDRMVVAGDAETGTAGTYLIRPDEAEVVAPMFRDYAAGTASAHSLAKRLNDAGVPTPRGARAWSPQTIIGILKNPVYKGCASWGRHERRVDERRQTVQGRKCSHYKLMRDEPTVVIPAPPITDEATWDACQQRLAANKRAKGGRPDRVYLLSAIARCPECGRGLSGKTEYKTRRKLYRCNRDATDRHLPMLTWQAASLEDMTAQAILAASNQPEYLEAAIEAAERRKCVPPVACGAEALKREYAELERREQVAVRAQVEALMDGRDGTPYLTVLSDVGRRRAEVAARLRQIEQAVSVERLVPVAATVAETTDALGALWRVMTTQDLLVSEKRDAIQSLVSRVIPHGQEGVEVVLQPDPRGDQKNKNTHQFFMRRP